MCRSGQRPSEDESQDDTVKHFDTASWADFVRGLVSEDRAREQQRHLDTGCVRCNRHLEMLRSVAADAASEQEPPAWAVRSVTTFFRMQQPRLRRELPRIPVTPIFDSLLAPMPTGTRSLLESSRHVVYNARQFTLDVRMDYSRSEREMLIVGQIVEREGQPVANAPAFLVSENSCKPRGKLTLCLSMDSNELIEVDLDHKSREDADSNLMEELFPGHWTAGDKEQD
jgi:hypothetical protein